MEACPAVIASVKDLVCFWSARVRELSISDEGSVYFEQDIRLGT